MAGPERIERVNEREEFDGFMNGFYAEIKRQNKFLGKQLRPQAVWNTMDEEAKDLAVVEAFLTVTPAELAGVMSIIHDAIHGKEVQ